MAVSITDYAAQKTLAIYPSQHFNRDVLLQSPSPTRPLLQYTTLEGATGITRFHSPTRRRLPQQSYTPTKKQTMGQSHIRRHAEIRFDYIGYNGQGVQMREFTARSDAAMSSMIQGAGDLVLAHTQHERVVFRINWPGYEHVDWYDQLTINPDGRPVTRAQLGVFIARNFARFVEKARRETSRSSEWNLTSSGIRFDHLVLVAVVNVCEGVWQADVAVDLR